MPIEATQPIDDRYLNFGMVSIIMPNYNAARFLNETIESVQAQTYPDWELLFVDDCSTDDSIQKVREFAKKDPRIRVFQNEKNSGAAYSRNFALREAKGKWIAFLDSDDVWLPRKLEEQLTFMAQTGAKFSYTAFERIDEKSESLGTIITGPKKVSRRALFRYDYLGCLTVMYDAKTIGLVQVEESLKNRNDYAIWLKASKFADCFYLDRCLAKYRVRAGSISHSGFKSKLKNQYRLFRVGEKKNAVSAAMCVAQNVFFGVLKKICYQKKTGQ